MQGPFKLGYFIKGAGKEDYFKAAGLGLRFFLILVIALLLIAGGLSVWRVFFPKPSQNISKPFVIALPGSTNIIDQSVVQKTEIPRRKWFMPIPYFSIYGEIRNVSSDATFKAGIGTQVGLRWDF